MKIIQTYWSKPSQGQNEGHAENRHTGGWLAEKYHYMSWALSCHSFRRFYDEVELYTDAAGKALLIDTLQLPYTKVHVCLDKLNHLPSLLWAAPKLYTYCLQQTPFIHADGDVYIWKKFDDTFEQSPLLAQSMETNWAYYNDILDTLRKDGYWMPEALAAIDPSNNNLQTINVGVFGGSNLAFIQAYCKDMLRFYLYNQKQLAGNNVGKLNPLDQFYAYHLALARQTSISLLATDEKQDFSELMLFNLVPQYHSYIHLLGAAKKNPLYCQMVALHLQHEFPAYYQKTKHLFTAPAPTAPKPKPPFEQFFASSMAALSFFDALPAINNSDELLMTINNGTTLSKMPKLQTLVQNIYLAENTRYQLSQQDAAMPTNAERFPAFVKAKTLLAATSPTDKSVLLQRPFVLSNAARIIALEYDVPAIIAQPDWLIKAATQVPNLEPEQHIFLYVKQDEDTVLLYPLGDSNQLLYYFSNGPFTGQALIDVLMEDEPDSNDITMRNYYAEVVFYFITNNVILTGYLVFPD